LYRLVLARPITGLQARNRWYKSSESAMLSQNGEGSHCDETFSSQRMRANPCPIHLRVPSITAAGKTSLYDRSLVKYTRFSSKSYWVIVLYDCSGWKLREHIATNWP